jgi:TolB-like protein/Flp pilus assembly protein TadD
VSLGARAFDILYALARHAGELVSKDQLFEWVWPGRVVEENNLQVHVSTLRKILGAELIVTIPGQGYRLTARLKADADAHSSPGPNAASAAPALVQSAPVHQAPSVERCTIAVLPFRNLGGLSQEEYFSDGIAEDVIEHLTHSPWLLVVSRNSSFTYRHSHASVSEICRELQVRYVVIGSVRRVPDESRESEAEGSTSAALAQRLRISAELIDGQRNEALWSQRFDRPLKDLLALQEHIAHQITSAIEPVALRREEQLALRSAASVQQGASSASDVQHWDLLMQARWHFWRSTREHLAQSEALLLQGLQEPAGSQGSSGLPRNSAALSLLAFVHMSRVWAGWAADAKGSLQEALRCAKRAVNLNDRDSYAHFTLGTALSCVGQMPQAIAEMEHALALYPQAASAAGELARLLAFSGRSQEAHEYALQAIDASPHDPHLSLWLRTRALACFVEGDYAQAVRHAMQAVTKRPDWFFTYYTLAVCQALAGQEQAARMSLQTAQDSGPYSLQALRIGHPFTQSEHLDRFVQTLRSLGWEG